MDARRMRYAMEWNPALPDGEKSRRRDVMLVLGSWRTADQIASSWQMSIFKEAGCGEDNMCDFVYLYRFETLEQLIESNMLGDSLPTLKCAPLKKRLADDVRTRRTHARLVVDHVPRVASEGQEKAFFIDFFMNITDTARVYLKERCGLQHEASIPLPPTTSIPLPSPAHPTLFSRIMAFLHLHGF